MPYLLVLAYADEQRAAEVLALLQRLPVGSTVDTKNVVGIVRRTDWTVILQHTASLDAQDDCPCRFWRPFIASLILAPGASTQRAHWQDFGVEANFEHRLEAVLPPGSSAVFMIVPRRTLGRLAEEVRRLRGTLLTSQIRSGPRSRTAT
jgi:uncharacterized membrane protein